MCTRDRWCGLCYRLSHGVWPWVILIAGLALLPVGARFGRAADSSAGVGSSTPATTQESVASLSRLMDQLAESARELSRDQFDYQAIIESVGRDPAKLVMWVKTNTRFVPYSGALRGPQGVLMDRVSNDLDRALLVAQLVNSSGYDCRLARGKLTDAEAAALIASAAPAPLPDAAGGTASESYLVMHAEVNNQTKALMNLVTPAI